MGSVRWIFGAVLVLAVACVAPDGAPAPAPPADAGVTCGPRGAVCPALSGFTITCEGGACVARAPGGDALADCAREGNYGTNLRYDARHCGACGASCADADFCADGACTPLCGAPLTRCGDACVDTATDRSNCGACGRACAAALRCAEGACVGCPTTTTRCQNTCADLTRDPAHCGACDRACAQGVRCRGGACADCEPGLTPCGDACVDAATDPSNCGACGRVCPVGVQCAGGACGACAPGFVDCGYGCVDTRRDVNHCGGCRQRCERWCIDGECPRCFPGSTYCEGDCYTAFQTPRHCGACGRACSGTCDAGRCEPCAPGLTFCGESCVDLARSTRHCGACGTTCAESEGCVAGACVTCAAGWRSCGGECLNLSTSTEACGACGIRCPSSSICDRGRCEALCSERLQAAHPDAHCGACGVACPANTICVEARCVAATPRPKAPISTTQVTSARPWFRWELPAGADGARVEVCPTRDCARVEAQWDATGDRLRAPTAFTPGVHFWRLYARRSGRVDAASGIVWEFRVPAALTLPDTGGASIRGVALVDDINGDGAADPITAECAGAPRCLEFRFSTPPGGAAPPPWLYTTPPGGTSGEWTTIYTLHGARHAGDLNGDGFGDVLLHLGWMYLQRSAVTDTGDILQLFAGGPSGLPRRFHAITSRSSFPALSGATYAAPIGDRDGDGYGDVAIWYLSLSAPYFAELSGGRPPTRGSRGSSSLPLTEWFLTGDFNADGYGDLVTTTSSTRSGYASVSLGAADPGSGGGGSVHGCGAPSDPIALPFRGFVADANDDGFDDLQAVWSNGVTTERVLLLGDPDGLSPTRCTRLP